MAAESQTEMCSICLESMKAGQGQSLFTAECSHVFHYSCIAKNVQHGNRDCPTCRVTWRNPPLLSVSPTRCLPYADDEPIPASTQPPSTAPASSTTPAQQGGANMTIKTFPEYPALSKSGQSDSFAVLVGIQAPPLSSEASDRAPIDLVAVLDVSGSMQGDKIRLLKQAMEFVIKNLGPNDRLSVITFSTTARRVTPLRRMTDAGRDFCIQAVNFLVADYGTNIIAGLKMAVKVLEQRRHKNPVSSIILLSDGQDNQNGNGQAFFGSLRSLPPCIRSNDTDVNQSDAVPVHTFGFGSDHDATALHAIADGSHGTFSYIESIEIIQDAFAMCLGGLLSVVAQELEIQVDSASPEVRIQSIRSGRLRSSIGQSKEHGVIYVGDVYAEEEKKFLVYVSIPPADDHDATQLLDVKCSYKDPLSKKSIMSETVKVGIRRPVAEDLSDDDKKACVEVEREKHRISVAEGIERAQDMAERGRLMEAQSLLKNQVNDLRELCDGDLEPTSYGLMADDLEDLQEMMSSKKMYEDRGRGFATATLLCHTTQRASTRVAKQSARKSTGGAYATPQMQQMVIDSRRMRQVDEDEAQQSAQTRGKKKGKKN